MLPTVNEYIYQDLSRKIADLKSAIATLNVSRERAEVAGGLAGVTLVNLPTTNNTPGDLMYATNGCKVGEAPNTGTGTIVYWNGATASWLRVADNGDPNTAGAGIPAVSPLTTKGDLWTYTNTNARLGVGANNTVLVADSAQATGNKWSATLAGLTLTQPTIGDFTNAQHSHQNAVNGSILDAAAIGSGVLANARVNFAAPDPIGSTTPNIGTFSIVHVSLNSGGNRDLRLESPDKANPIRWILRANATAEGGANAGSDLDLFSGDDSGGFALRWRIFRSSGQADYQFLWRALHFGGLSSAPTAAVGAAAGTGASITSPVAGTDSSGLISLVTGTATGANGILATITFNTAYGSAPNVTLTPANGNAADPATNAPAAFVDQASTTTAHFVIKSGNIALTISKTYLWYYKIEQ